MSTLKQISNQSTFNSWDKLIIYCTNHRSLGWVIL